MNPILVLNGLPYKVVKFATDNMGEISGAVDQAAHARSGTRSAAQILVR